MSLVWFDEVDFLKCSRSASQLSFTNLFIIIYFAPVPSYPPARTDRDPAAKTAASPAAPRPGCRAAAAGGGAGLGLCWLDNRCNYTTNGGLCYSHPRLWSPLPRAAPAPLTAAGSTACPHCPSVSRWPPPSE